MPPRVSFDREPPLSQAAPILPEGARDVRRADLSDNERPDLDDPGVDRVEKSARLDVQNGAFHVRLGPGLDLPREPLDFLP